MRSRAEGPVGRLQVLLAPVALVVVVASVISTLTAIGHLHSTSPAASPNVLSAPLYISTRETAHLFCPSGLSFSPGGARLAVVGTTTPCQTTSPSSPTFVAHALAIYDGHTGALIRTVGLDQFIGAGSRGDGSLEYIRAVAYTGLGWTPDGSACAVVFTAFDSADHLLPDNVLDSGLLLVNATSPQLAPAVIRGDGGFFSDATGVFAGLPIWNIQLGIASEPTAPSAGLSYAWSAYGHLQATLPLSQSPLAHLPVIAGPRYPVGNPIGGSTFTIWQPGVVIGPAAWGKATDSTAFVTAFPTWSPSGAYATEMIVGVALTSARGVSAAGAVPVNATPRLYRPGALPGVPARDAALGAVATQVGADGWAIVSWNPNGTVLASVNCQDKQGETLQLRNTDSGAISEVAPVPLYAKDAGCRTYNGAEEEGDYLNTNESLIWAPDGTHVLLSDQADSAIIVWSVPQPTTAESTQPQAPDNTADTSLGLRNRDLILRGPLDLR